MIPVILSGGSGTRLWPVSRQGHPKQFCEFLDESLFVKSLKRVLPLGSPWTITVGDLKVLTVRALNELNLPLDQAIYEPSGRNTAPAIAVLCRVLELRGLASEVVGVFPADHLVDDEETFLASVRKGEEFAREGHIVTLGVKPTFAATGYGYIETAGPMLAGDESALRAVGFREKPDEQTAAGFMVHGGYFWNAGMFIFKVQTMIESLKSLAPEVWSQVARLRVDLSNLAEIYEVVPRVSIDYAVMEKLSQHVCVPCTFEWTDLGSWDSIASLNRRQASRQANVVEVESQGNFIVTYGTKAYALIGTENLEIVDTQDALLITRRGMSEKVKEAVEQLKDRQVKAATAHPWEIRPWGRFDILKSSSDCKAKVISVDPGAQISYQSHERRAEHWIVIKGEGEVTIDGQTTPVGPDQHIYVPQGAKHRMRNTGTHVLAFVEVQLGSYFGEDDIVRYADDFGRV